MMKILILNILLLTASAVFANNEAESIESEELSPFNNNKNINSGIRGGSYFAQSSHSVLNSNGNSVVVSRRFNSDGKEEKYISVDSPKVRIDGDYFSCTTLTCPSDAHNCHVTSETIAEDRDNLKTVAECQDKDGKVLERKEFTERNPYPKDEPPYSRVAEVDRDGQISIQDSNGRQSFVANKKLTPEEEEKINKEIAEQTRRWQQEFARQQQLFQQQMEEFNKALQNSFGPNFPFGGNRFPISTFDTSFGSDFPFGPSFGFSNNWPFHNFNTFSSFPSFPSYPQRPVTNTNRYPFNSYHPQMPNPDDRAVFETTYPDNAQRPSTRTTVTSRQPQTEIDTNTASGEENEIYDATTNRLDNNIVNYYDKYRYAHTN